MNLQRVFSKPVPLYAILISLLVSAIIISPSQPVNRDGIAYLHTTSVYLESGFKAAFSIYYKWPFNSIVIAYLSKLTGLSLENSAYFATAVYMAIISFAFVTLLKQLGANRQQQWWACFVILSIHSLVHQQTYILRDYGYWAFSLLAFSAFLRLLRTHQYQWGLAWGALMAVAVMYRVEGIAFLVALPLLCFFLPDLSFKEKLRLYIVANIINLVGAIVFLLFFQHDLGRLGRLDINFLIGGVVEAFKENAAVIRHQLIGDVGWDHEFVALSSIFVGIYFSTLIKALGFLFSLLFCYAIYNSLLPKTKYAKLFLSALLAINIVVVWVFLVRSYFLVDRYLVSTALILAVWVSFGLAHLHERLLDKKAKDWKQRSIKATILLGLLTITVGNLFHFGYSKSYIKQAGLWSKANLPPTAKVCSNNEQFIFYVRPKPNDKNRYVLASDLPVSPVWQGCEYIGLRVKRHAVIETVSKQLQDNILFVTKNDRPEAMFIYKNPNV